MKTTIDLPDDLMVSLKVKAAQEGWKMKTIVEAALRQFLNQQAEDELSSEEMPTFSVGKVYKEDLSDFREEYYDERHY